MQDKTINEFMDSKLLQLKNDLIEKLSTLISFQFDSQDIEQRGIGDKVESILSRKIFEMSSKTIKVLSARSKRSIEDLGIEYHDYNIFIDYKSHDKKGKFSMPNLISIDRAKKYLSLEKNQLWYIFVDYETTNHITTIVNVDVHPIEELPWEALAIQNIGKGQIQIINNNKLMNYTNATREEWLNELRLHALAFIERQITVFNKRRSLWTR